MTPEYKERLKRGKLDYKTLCLNATEFNKTKEEIVRTIVNAETPMWGNLIVKI